jgi:hypothetical protein
VDQEVVWRLGEIAHLGAARSLPSALGGLELLHLDAPRREAAELAFYLCLEGELLIDLPYGRFLHLRALDACELGACERVLTPVESATVLRMARG